MTELEELRKQLGHVLEANRDLEYRNRQLCEALEAHNTKQAEDGGLGYHVWMPDEENCLETLSCPVLIPAEWLRNLCQEAAANAEPKAEAFDALVMMVQEEIPGLRAAANRMETHIYNLRKAALDACAQQKGETDHA